MSTLLEVVASVGDLNDQMVIFARAPWEAGSEAVAVMDFEAPEGFSYVLEAAIAQEVLQVWSDWRQERKPSAEEAVAAVIHYALTDTHDEPAEG